MPHFLLQAHPFGLQQLYVFLIQESPQALPSHFHDLRHETTSRFFEKGLNPIGATTITGHQDTDALYAFKSRGFGGEIGIDINERGIHLLYPAHLISNTA